MKLRYLLLGLMACAVLSCSDDNEAFNPGIDGTAFTFTPAPGGAVMHYRLPANRDITGIYVYYKDAYGNDIVRSGSTACDSLMITGFNEARNAVPAEVRLQRRDRIESEPIAVTFSTGDSDPVAFMNSLEVLSDWGGFTITYDSIRPEAEGLFHVFYLGTDPLTGLPDTLLISTQTLTQAAQYEKQLFVVKQDVTHPVVIVSCEDLRGNRVDARVFDGVECMYPEQLGSDKFDFYCSRSLIDDNLKLGPQYLFDGDKIGHGAFSYNFENNTHYYFSFVAGPDCAGEKAEPMYIDLKRNKVLKSIKVYDQMGTPYNSDLYSFETGPYDVAGEWGLLPKAITIYGARDDGDKMKIKDKDMSSFEWKVLGFGERNTSYANCYPTNYERFPSSPLDAQNIEETFLEINTPAVGQGDGYRYLKIVVNNVFAPYYDYYDPFSTFFFGFANEKNYVTFHEMEIFTKIDN